ncbi:HAMP domain-containing histidine kinase [Sphingomonas donggukensis]|uniref:histidine kinase n=1 Tax=Sphingomonas donggukensis TaxID=2949093 RepID=A0ABY4TX28_9SPHN|nr:HAMP domain-containing sensor histidine kinase [Sphingomonas donggukensis]URW74863.1 HAMP domain-containing histidine kinase [Sphingomonas donggukensis]
MRLLPRRAAYRIAVLSAGAFALATTLLGVLVFYAAHVTFARQLDASIADASAALVTEYRAEGRDGLNEALGRREQRAGDELGYALFGTDGRRIAGRMVTDRPPVGWSDIVFQDPIEGPDPARALAVDLPDGDRLVVAADREPLENIDATILSIFAGALVVVVIVGASGGLLLGGYLRRRLAGITATADAIVAGDLGSRVPIGRAGDGVGSDEFDRVGASLNLMLGRIDTLVANLRQVSADVAHDLRTPLSRLRAQLEQAGAAGSDPVRHAAAIEAAIDHCDQILLIFEAILRIAEIEEGGARAWFAPFDLSRLTEEIADAVTPAAEEGGRSIAAAGEPACVINGDRQLVAQAVVNLTENAMRHTPPGTRVTIDVRRVGTDIVLTVADDGPGVAAGDRTRILGRFVRLEAARSTPGNGLGLSLVAAVAALHRAVVGIEDNAPGLRVVIAFPGGR